LPERDTYSRTKGWLMDRIKIAMGGYVAEELIYGETTTGTQNDIKQATSIARRMVTEWGMSDELGFVALGQEDEPIFIGKEIAQHKDYSEDTATRIDVSVRTLLKDALDETRVILTEHKDQLDTLAKNLVKEETLDDAEIRILLGFPPRESITSLKIETSEPEDSESDPENEDEEK